MLGFPIEGFEEEILNMLQKINNIREKGKKRVCPVSTRFERELKKLECSINYNKGKKGNGLTRGGDKELCLT